MLRFAGILTTMLVAGSVAVGDEGTKDATKAGAPLHPHFKMATTLGDIVLELDAEKAPVTVLNFAQYAEDKFFDGTIFHRVIGNFMIQAGGFTIDGKKTEGLRDGILNEWQNGLKNVRGSISMARLGGKPDSGSSQFFISVVDNPFLDQQQRDGAAYAVFGKVVEGMDVVDRIKDLEVGSHDTIPGGKVPKEPVVIKSVQLIGEFDRTKAEEAAKAAREKVGAARAAAEEAEKKAKAAAKEAANKAKVEGLKVMREHVTKLETETGKKAVFTNSGMAYLILEEGEGDLPKPTDTVKVHYSGWLLDGTKFDSSYDRGKPATFALNRVIKGWTEGVGLMKVGSKHKLVIPADLAYGEGGRPSIPPNSTLVFDVELLEIITK